MNELKSESINDFLNYYHYLHDSFITYINYNIDKAQIVLLIDVYWTGHDSVKKAKNYLMNQEKVRMVFNSVKKYFCKDISFSDYIDKICIETIEIESKQCLLFTNGEKNPFIYIICDSIQYEKII